MLNPKSIFMISGDKFDCILLENAFSAAQLDCKITCFSSGDGLLAYFSHKNIHTDEACLPTPDLILLDLSMSGMNGKEIIKKINTDVDLKSVPVIAWTKSNDKTYSMRKNDSGTTVIIGKKPVAFRDFVDAANSLMTFWYKFAKMPPGRCLHDFNVPENSVYMCKDHR